jgi:hypothetical protein
MKGCYLTFSVLDLENDKRGSSPKWGHLSYSTRFFWYLGRRFLSKQKSEDERTEEISQEVGGREVNPIQPNMQSEPHGVVVDGVPALPGVVSVAVAKESGGHLDKVASGGKPNTTLSTNLPKVNIHTNFHFVSFYVSFKFVVKLLTSSPRYFEFRALVSFLQPLMIIPFSTNRVSC